MARSAATTAIHMTVPSKVENQVSTTKIRITAARPVSKTSSRSRIHRARKRPVNTGSRQCSGLLIHAAPPLLLVAARPQCDRSRRRTRRRERRPARRQAGARHQDEIEQSPRKIGQLPTDDESAAGDGHGPERDRAGNRFRDRLLYLLKGTLPRETAATASKNWRRGREAHQ